MTSSSQSSTAADPQVIIEMMTRFFDQIGLPWASVTDKLDTFLPGICIQQGVLHFNVNDLSWPGDLLHEAGHIATSPPSRRSLLAGNLNSTPAEEMAAMAWSYAAAVAIGIDPLTVFHEGGYKGGGAQYAYQYSSGLPPGGPGVPMLQWWGMTQRFPAMDSWLRQTEDLT